MLQNLQTIVQYRRSGVELHDAGFSLNAELGVIERVGKIEAYEAVIFHCARVFEVVLRCAVDDTVGERPNTIYGSMSRLAELGLLGGKIQKSLFHSLRRLGNESQ